MPTYTLEITMKTPSGDVSGSRAFADADGGTAALPELHEAIAGETTDEELVWTCDVSQVKAIIIKATVDMTIKTNSDSAPADTLALKANSPYVWTIDSLDAFQLGTDVTKLYVSNAGSTAGTLDIAGSYDPTP
jgi:hypothetical protein